MSLLRERILYLPRAEVRECLPAISEQVELAATTYRSMAAGEVEMPPKPGVHPRPDSFIHAMPAYLPRTDIAAIKWVSGYPANPGAGLPYISGLIVLNDAANGMPVAVMDAAEITAARTAAASGACVRALAPQGWRRAGLIGFGEQGRRHRDVLGVLNPEVEIRAYDPVMPSGAADGVEIAETPKDACAGAEVIVTSAPIVSAPAPEIGGGWLAEHALVLPIDFDASVRAEVATDADLFAVDDLDQYRYYVGEGHFAGWPERGEQVGRTLERSAAAGRVVVCNLGVGALDAAFADRVVAGARERDLGTWLRR